MVSTPYIFILSDEWTFKLSEFSWSLSNLIFDSNNGLVREGAKILSGFPFCDKVRVVSGSKN